VVTETYAVLTRMPAPFRNLDCHCISGRLKYRFPSI
jgi:hypothetical protein